MLERKEFKRIFIRAVDMICVSSLDDRGDRWRKNLQTIFRPSSARSQRLRAGIHLVGNFVPGFEDLCTRLVTSTGHFPINSRNLVMIGYGGEQTIFIGEIAGVKKVFKVNRDSLGLERNQLLQKAKELQQEYEKISSCYSHLSGFIPEETFFIGNGHLCKMPAVITVQPYIKGEIRCFFDDHSDEQLWQLLTENSSLRTQFSLFSETFLGEYSRSGWCIDVLGNKNLSIVQNASRYRLMLLDPHVILNSKLLSARPPELTSRLRERINYISRLSTRLTQENRR